MGILDKLLGRRARTATNLAKEIEAQEAAVAASQLRIEQAQHSRKAAIEDFDDPRHKAADEEIAAARRDIERRETAIEALKAAHAERFDLETREAFRREYEEERKAALAVDARIGEYVAAAKTIAQFCRDGTAAGYRRDQLLKRAKELREEVEFYRVEAEGYDFAVGSLPYGDQQGFLHCPRQP